MHKQSPKLRKIFSFFSRIVGFYHSKWKELSMFSIDASAIRIFKHEWLFANYIQDGYDFIVVFPPFGLFVIQSCIHVINYIGSYHLTIEHRAHAWSFMAQKDWKKRKVFLELFKNIVASALDHQIMHYFWESNMQHSFNILKEF